MAMVAASIIDPGVYFAMNSPAAIIGTDAATVAATVSSWGFIVTPETLTATAAEIGENSILSRAGGAPTLAVGIAQILHSVLPGAGMMAFWYHFAILFEALFILTAVDAGTRAGRFMLQDLLGNFVPSLKRTEAWGPNLIATAGCVGLWGWFLYQGVTDPLGGINMLWPLFGIANQMLAGIALMLCTVVLFKMKRDSYAWVAILPALWLLICTTTAGWMKLFDSNPSVGFLAQANRYRHAISADELIPPSADLGAMQQVMISNYINAALTAAFMVVVFAVLLYSIKVIVKARSVDVRTDRETAYVALWPQEVEV
jgi:carbon starvation protein